MTEQTIPIFQDKKYKILIDAVRNGCCIFVGAGISKLAGYPLWNELTGMMISEYFLTNHKVSYGKKLVLESEPNSIDVMSYLKSLDNDTSFFVAKIKSILQRSRKEFEDKNLHKADEVFKALKFLNNDKNFFITTNIDKELEKNLHFNNIFVNDNFTYNGSVEPVPKSLYYVHGRIDNDQSWIFTREEYNESYLKDRSPVMQFLIKVFKKPVLFIGYSLRDFEVLQAVYKANLERAVGNGVAATSDLPCGCFLLEGCCNRDGHLWNIQTEAARKNYRIERISYSIEEHGYDSIFKILEHLKEVSDAKEVKSLGDGDVNSA